MNSGAVSAVFHFEKSQFYILGYYTGAVTVISQLPFVSRLVLVLHKGHHLEGSVGMTEFLCKPEGFGPKTLPVSLMHWQLKVGMWAYSFWGKTHPFSV